MLTARIGGIAFEGSPADGQSAYMISPDGWSGWDDGTAVRREAVSRPGAHGSFGTRGFRDSRVISIAGWILASTSTELQHMRNRLMGLLADGDSGRLEVEQPLGTTWANVMLADIPSVKVRGATECEAEYQIQFWAPLPQKFGDVRTFAAGAPATHYGNVLATPRLLIGPGAGGYTVTGPDGRVVVVATAPAGEHYIDFATGGLFTAAGVRQAGTISVYQPWEIPVGSPGVVATISGSRTLFQQVTDTFM